MWSRRCVSECILAAFVPVSIHEKIEKYREAFQLLYDQTEYGRESWDLSAHNENIQSQRIDHPLYRSYAELFLLFVIGSSSLIQ